MHSSDMIPTAYLLHDCGKPCLKDTPAHCVWSALQTTIPSTSASSVTNARACASTSTIKRGTALHSGADLGSVSSFA